MRILHTSDWHLGRSLYGRKRYQEFSAFFDWLLATLESEKIDVLLVAGDIFDTCVPSNRAQELYYQFLCGVAGSTCGHIVIIGGNHDSPSFLNAPKGLLQALNAYVVGSAADVPEDEVIVLRDKDSKPQAIICAVPYLRDRDIRLSQAGESVQDKNTRLIEGITSHYKAVCQFAEEKQKALSKDGLGKTPIIGMGHLFTTGGKTVDGEGLRELYVGTLGSVGKDVFPTSIDYLALGHLHSAQRVAKQEHIRYSGSPLPMSFGEAKQEKKVIIVEMNGSEKTIREITVPCFQALKRITGDLEEIHKQLKALKSDNAEYWLEIVYTGSSIVSNLKGALEETLAGTPMEIRRIKNNQVIDQIIRAERNNESLAELNETEVFKRRMEAANVPDAERPDLLNSYHELIQTLKEEDVNKD